MESSESLKFTEMELVLETLEEEFNSTQAGGKQGRIYANGREIILLFMH